MVQNTLEKKSTRTRIRGMLNEAKINAMFDILSDSAIEETIKIYLNMVTRAGLNGRVLDEKKTLAALMPDEAKMALKEKFGIDIATDSAKVAIGEELFSRLMKYMTRHPERLTIGIYDTLVEHKNFHHIVSMVQKKQMQDGTVSLIPTNTGLSMKRAIDGEFIINLQNLLIEKVKMLIESLTKKDLVGANLGAKSKSLRDLLAANHMMRLDVTPDQAMEQTYRETTTSDDGKTTRENTVRYVQRSSQAWNSKKD